jgi:lipopolysaccharide transport system permease protein
MTSLPSTEVSSEEKARTPEASDDGVWDVVITPRARWFSLHLADLWRYRDLLVLLVRRDFRSTYAHTLLGPLWFVIDPIARALLFTVVFGKIASIPTGGIPDFLFYLSGVTIWQLFATCVNTNSDFLVANLSVFGKVFFPRLIVPLAQTLANLILFLVPLALLAIFVAAFWLRGSSIEVTWALALLPAIVLVATVLGLGLALIVSALTVKYRDLNVAVAYAVGAVMFISPVVAPLSSVGGGIRTAMELNPMTPMIEWFRYGVLGSGTASAWGFAYAAAVGLVLVVLGVTTVSRVEQSFVDTA